jgi:hypothetical protein
MIYRPKRTMPSESITQWLSVVSTHLTARGKVFSLCNDALVVIDIVLPAMFGLVLVWEARIEACQKGELQLRHCHSQLREPELRKAYQLYILISRRSHFNNSPSGNWPRKSRDVGLTSHKLEGFGLSIFVRHVCGVCRE